MSRKYAALSVEQMSQTPIPQTVYPPRLRVAGHFGELIQGRIGAQGPLALISLPCPAVWVECGTDIVEPDCLIGPNRFRALCHALDLPLPAQRPNLIATMPPGGGAGSSTAGLVALARVLGYAGTPEHLAHICAQVEGASDPLMFPKAERLLFAPREGRVLQVLPALPRFEVLGGFFGPVQQTNPADVAFPDVADLLIAWRRDMDLTTMAALASTSARRTLQMRGPRRDPTEGLAKALGAVGWIIAHTGNARGLIFEPGAIPADAKAQLHAAGFQGVLSFAAGGAA